MDRVQALSLERMLLLTEVRDWCVQRQSTLSVQCGIGVPRALTAEHLEVLKSVEAMERRVLKPFT